MLLNEEINLNIKDLNVRKEILSLAEKNRVNSICFSYNIPTYKIELFNNYNNYINYDINSFLNKISSIRKEKNDIQIYSGLEISYETYQISYYRTYKKKFDILKLRLTNLKNKFMYVNPNNNVDYPILYAKTVCEALETGIFNILSDPDLFLIYSKTIDHNKIQDYKRNCLLASQIIFDKARELGIPIELTCDIDYSNLNIDKKLYELFWAYSQKLTDLDIIIDKDIFNKVVNRGCIIKKINKNLIMNDKLEVYKSINNNIILDHLYRNIEDSLSYETYVIKYVLESVEFSDVSNEDVLDKIIVVINNLKNDLVKNYNIFQERFQNYEFDNAFYKELKFCFESQMRIIEDIKSFVCLSLDIGCITGAEIINITTQLAELNYSKNSFNQQRILNQVNKFYMRRNNTSLNLTLKKLLINKNTINSDGFVSIVMMFFIMLYFGFGIIYLIYIINLINN